MKVLFLDIDGVLNSDRTLYDDVSLEDDLIMNLKAIIDKTGAKIILSSSWRCIPSAVQKLMGKLDEHDLYLSGLTKDGVEVSTVEALGFKPTERYTDTDYSGSCPKDITHDRGAEIAVWLDEHQDRVDSFVILDDEDYDIKLYYPSHLVLTRYETGLTEANVEEAIKILNKGK